jgi:hypothetical protein
MTHIHTVTASERDPRDPETEYAVCVSCGASVYSFFIEDDGDRLGAWSQWLTRKDN